MKVLTNFRIKLLLFDTQSIVHLNMRGLKWILLALLVIVLPLSYHYQTILWQSSSKDELGILIQGVPKNAPIKQTKMAKHGGHVNIPKWSSGVQKGPKLPT